MGVSGVSQTGEVGASLATGWEMKVEGMVLSHDCGDQIYHV